MILLCNVIFDFEVINNKFKNQFPDMSLELMVFCVCLFNAGVGVYRVHKTLCNQHKENIYTYYTILILNNKKVTQFKCHSCHWNVRLMP